MTLPPRGPGFLAVDKPVGPTSHDVVRTVRSALSTRRVGHAGTLDPFATGLLLLGIDRATRLLEYVSGLDKEYVATAELGVSTTTHDPEGEVTARTEGWRQLSTGQLEEAFGALEGEGEQRPPRFSAKKVEGERAYARARRGEAVELAPARVTIHAIELVGVDLPLIRFRVRCSTGTYIRAIARDLGLALGVGAHLTSLRRTAIGQIRVERAVSLEALRAPERWVRGWIPVLEAVSHLPRVEVDSEEASGISQGQSPPLGKIPQAAALPEGRPVVVVHDGTLLAIARREGLRLRPRKVWPPEGRTSG